MSDVKTVRSDTVSSLKSIAALATSLATSLESGAKVPDVVKSANELASTSMLFVFTLGELASTEVTAAKVAQVAAKRHAVRGPGGRFVKAS